MGAWRHWHQALSDLTARGAAACVMVSALVYTAEVVARYYLSAPLNWSGDLSSYLLCACVFLALPKVTSDGGHIAVTYLLERLGPRAQRSYARVLWIVTGMACLVTACFIAIEGWRQFQSGSLTSQANQIPKWILAALAFYGFASAALHLFTARGDLVMKEQGL
jgi:TRAP-type C4-dicarboxylate transport system permease small subunit